MLYKKARHCRAFCIESLCSPRTDAVIQKLAPHHWMVKSFQGVVIFAPENCPSEAAQRARKLAGHLSAQRIPYRETSSANFSSLSSQDEANRVMSVMNGPVPVVCVNGRAKANPTPEEVVAEYRRGRSG